MVNAIESTGYTGTHAVELLGGARALGTPTTAISGPMCPGRAYVLDLNVPSALETRAKPMYAPQF